MKIAALTNTSVYEGCSVISCLKRFSWIDLASANGFFLCTCDVKLLLKVLLTLVLMGFTYSYRRLIPVRT